MATTHHSIDIYPIHRVPATRPFIWLAEGWDSLMHHKAASLTYGALVALIGSVILAYNDHPLYIGASVTAFLVVGPVITSGLCELSRRRDHGDTSSFLGSLDAIGRNYVELLRLAAVLVFTALICFNLAAMYLYSTTGSAVPAFASMAWGDILAQLSSAHVAAYALAFLVISCVVFLLSVVSVPMIIDRHVNAEIAMRISLRVALQDIPAMIIWSGLIISLVAFGFGTKLWGMVVVIPLLGHATWYAYRDLVEEA